MSALKDTRVRRGGVTSRQWSGTINSVSLTTASELRLSFVMASKGGGESDVQMEIGPADFPMLVESMCAVDRQAAMAAMAIELSRQIDLQPQRNIAIRKRTAAKILDAAEEKYYAKPTGQDDRERVIMDGIKEIRSELKLD
jgi:hypothetical protein